MATKGKSGRTHQHQEQADTHAQFLMQNVLNDVLRQLERYERTVEGVNRTNSMKRCKEGDLNHVTVEDNFEALKGKLMAFSGMQNSFNGKFTKSATNRVCEWITQRSPESYSGELKQALVNTLDACKGAYAPTVESVEMTEEMLQDFSERLAKATVIWHYKEVPFEKDPEAVVIKPKQYKIRANEKATYDAEEIKEKFQDHAIAPRTVIAQQLDSIIQKDSEAKESHSDESCREESKKEQHEVPVSIPEESKQIDSKRQVETENLESIPEGSSLKSDPSAANPVDNSEDDKKQIEASADEIINPLSSKSKRKGDEEGRQLDDDRHACFVSYWNWKWLKYW